MFSRRQVIGGVVTAPWILAALPAGAAETPPSLEEFLTEDFERDAALSPNGKTIAVLSVRESGKKKNAEILLLNADDPTGGPKRLTLGDMDARSVAWANDDRLLITIYLRAKGDTNISNTGSRITERIKPEDIPIVRRMLVIGADGRNSAILFDDGTEKLNTTFDLAQVIDLLPHDPRNVLMKAWDYEDGVWGIYKVDVYTGKSQQTERGGPLTQGWLTQDGQPVARYDLNARGTVMSIYLRAPGAKDWAFYRKLRSDEMNKQEFVLAGATAEPGVLLALTRSGPAATMSVRRFDLATRTLGEVVASRPDRDIDGVLHNRNGQLLASYFVDDRLTYQFADPTMTAHFKGLNKFLGDECNIRIFDIADNGERFLAWTSGPRDPGSIFFYDKAAKRFECIGQRQPHLKMERLALMETLAVKARDGIQITAYLTVPKASGPRPLVVMPHGGPEARDSYDFDRFAQTLAAQGWMVLQPNFRGSSGYGQAFADAGRKHWGDRMQEDVEDAVAHVLASGRVDAQRIAICGASYGGYAALMGAVRKPELYKAVVAIAGDADLVESIAFAKTEDGPDSPSYHYWLETIGDPATDRAMLEAASPALRAGEIQAPVLLIHGMDDTIVSPKQSRLMSKALKTAGKPCELIEMKNVGHRGWPTENWRLVMKKSADHIAKAFA